jgi:hypothetical protein
LAVFDSVTNTVVQRVALTLKRQRHLGGLGDSRRLRELVRERVSEFASDMIDINIATLLACVSGSTISEFAGRVRRDLGARI